MTKVWMVHALLGKHTQDFLKGGYAAVGWLPDKDLSRKNRDEIFQLYKETHPEETPRQAGAKAGQLARFVLDVQSGDYIITRPDNTRELHYGLVENGPIYYFKGQDSCPWPHRRKVKWAEETIMRDDLSVPFQQALKAARTVFQVYHTDEFLRSIGKGGRTTPPDNPYKVVLGQILQLRPEEFEALVGDLLVAVGFDNPQVVGKSGDGGVDVKGELNISNLVKVNTYVQVKRYKNKKVNEKVVKALRGKIPGGGQGAVITTSDFTSGAKGAAEAAAPTHIGLISGRQLVDLLVQHWNAESIAEDSEDHPSWHKRLGLTPGLVRQ